jgi:serine/threonine-protein kinase
MSPEQLRGDRDIDGRADIYALGALTYELLSGRPPFEGNNAHEVMRLAARSDAEPLSVLCPDLPAGLADVVVKAMHRDRSKRFATTTELREALLPYWSGTRPDFDAPPDATCAPADRARSAPPPAEVVAPVSPEPPTSPPPAAIAQARRVATTPTRVPRRHYRRIIALAVAVCVFFVLITGGVAVTVVDLVRGVHSSAAPGATLPAK